jgi:hypothetical protein
MSEQAARKQEPRKEPVRPHQLGQAAFRAILPEDIEWKSFAAFPPEARLAVLVGHPLEQGPYMVRIKVPHGVKLMPHRHPEDRIYTVISGVFYIGVKKKLLHRRRRSVPEIHKPSLNQPLNDRENHRGRDPEHEHSISCFQRSQQSPRRRHNQITITQGRVVDR